MKLQSIVCHLGNSIAAGCPAEVYDWEPGWVLKLYFDRFNPRIADFGHRIATAISAGISAPAAGEIVNVNAREGLLYIKCDGQPMGEDLAKHPWRLVSYARTSAELHVGMHTKPMQADLPPLRRRLEHKIRDAKPLSENLHSAVLKALETMPDGDCLCHGDFHLGNIMLNQPEPVIVDWVDASLGSPLADVARTSILMQGMVAVEPQFSRFQSLGIRLLYAVYLHRYFQLRPGGYDEYRHWLLIVAAGRLYEGITGWESWLLVQTGKFLNSSGIW